MPRKKTADPRSIFHLRLSQAERAEFDSKAQSASLTTAEFIRRACRNVVITSLADKRARMLGIQLERRLEPAQRLLILPTRAQRGPVPVEQLDAVGLVLEPLLEHPDRLVVPPVAHEHLGDPAQRERVESAIGAVGDLPNIALSGRKLPVRVFVIRHGAVLAVFVILHPRRAPYWLVGHFRISPAELLKAE